MKVIVRGIQFFVDYDVSAHVERRVGDALDCFAGQVGTVTVWLYGPGEDRSDGRSTCRMVAEMMHGSPLIVTQESPTMGESIDRAADRLGNNVGRWLERQREESRDRTRRTSQIAKGSLPDRRRAS